ncbi:MULTISPECIES: hypothetical protein [unclassified Streptomyces]
MRRGSRPARERQYEHIKESGEKRGIEGRTTMTKQQLENALGH